MSVDGSDYQHERESELQKLEELKAQSAMKDNELKLKETELDQLKEQLKMWNTKIAEKNLKLSMIEKEVAQLKINAEISKQENGHLDSKIKRNEEALELLKGVTPEDAEMVEKMKQAIAKEISGTPIKSIDLEYGHIYLAVCEKNGYIIATEQNTHSVTILSKEGKKIRSLGGVEKFNFPSGVAVSNDDHILVTDRHRLQKLTFDGDCVKSLGSYERGNGLLQFSYPYGIAVHPTTGQIFVVEEDNHRIQVLNADFTFSYMINQDDFNISLCPYDITLDTDGYMYIADDGNNCIMKLDVTKNGQPRIIGKFSSMGSAPGQLDKPNSIAVRNSLVYVNERINERVSIFDTQGRFLYCFGGKNQTDGYQFNDPWSVAVDKLGNLYVSDVGKKRILVY